MLHQAAHILWRNHEGAPDYLHTNERTWSFYTPCDRGSFFFFGFVYMIQKSSEHNRRRSKIVEADVIRQKFQMRFELPNRNRVANDDVTIINCSQIVFESCCVNGTNRKQNNKWQRGKKSEIVVALWRMQPIFTKPVGDFRTKISRFLLMYHMWYTAR